MRRKRCDRLDSETEATPAPPGCGSGGIAAQSDVKAVIVFVKSYNCSQWSKNVRSAGRELPRGLCGGVAVVRESVRRCVCDLRPFVCDALCRRDMIIVVVDNQTASSNDTETVDGG